MMEEMVEEEETRGGCGGRWSGSGRERRRSVSTFHPIRHRFCTKCSAITFSFQDEKETVRPGANEERDG